MSKSWQEEMALENIVMNMNRYKYIDENKQHLHTLDGKPLIGTSTVTKIIAKPLTWWASGMALEQLGWTNPKLVKREEGVKIAFDARQRLIENYIIGDAEKYYDLLQECYRAHDTKKKESGITGTDMHAVLESYVKSMIESNGGKPVKSDIAPVVASFSEWAVENIERFIFSEAHCYSERLWVGGIADAGAVMKDGMTTIIDFKSSKDAYYDQWIQAAGYAIQFSENGILDREGNQIGEKFQTDVLFIVPFGASDVTPRLHFDVKGRMEDFEAAVKLYKGSQIFSN